MSFFRRWIPDQETLERSRWLAWLAPWLGQPALWVWSRHGVALGVSIGIFFGMLVPVAQIPASAVAAIVLRANLPAAAASTLVSNPVTFAPVYYLAYRLGNIVLEPTAPKSASEKDSEAEQKATELHQTIHGSEKVGFWQGIKMMGKPLMVGLAILAVSGGLLAYVLISLIWSAHQWYKMRSGKG